MLPLGKDLTQKKIDIEEFKNLTERILHHLPDVLSGYETKANYRLYFVVSGNTTKQLRPVNQDLFISDPINFAQAFDKYSSTVQKIRGGSQKYSQLEKENIDQVLYTIQQAIGLGLDIFANPNSARKHVGNRFEELIKAVFSDIKVQNKKMILKIPYQSEDKEKIYKCETDLILSPYDRILSTDQSIKPNEVVVSIKTSSKDRMGKIFMDRILMENFVNQKVKMIGIFLNDVQRKEMDNINFTLVSGLFMVYTRFLTQLEGVYYLDSPPSASKAPFNSYIRPFSDLLTKDLNNILTP